MQPDHYSLAADEYGETQNRSLVYTGVRLQYFAIPIFWSKTELRILRKARLEKAVGQE